MHITKHALGRAMDMLIKPEAIRAAIDKPQKIRPAQQPGHEYWDHGKITLVVEADRVITILWRTDSRWRLGYAVLPELAGRERRTHTGAA